MTYFSIFIVSAFSIALPATAAAVRIKRLQGRFIPLAVLLWTGLANEAVSFLLIKRCHNNSINSNLYTLLEFLLMLWFFYRSGTAPRARYLLAATLGAAVWIADAFVLHTFLVHITLTRILFSMFVVYLSFDKINEFIFSEEAGQQKLQLLLWFSFFAYYAYQAFISIFELFPMGISNGFYMRLYLILSLINFFTNLVYTIIILWIPKQMAYTTR